MITFKNTPLIYNLILKDKIEMRGILLYFYISIKPPHSTVNWKNKVLTTEWHKLTFKHCFEGNKLWINSYSYAHSYYW